MSSQSQPILASNGQPDSEPSAAIWIVQGSTGEYSDRSEWNVYAFTAEEPARAYVEFLTAKRQEFGPRPRIFGYEERRVIEKAMLAFDPEYQEDYTGASWWVARIDFAPPSALGLSAPDASTRPDRTREDQSK